MHKTQCLPVRQRPHSVGMCDVHADIRAGSRVAIARNAVARDYVPMGIPNQYRYHPIRMFPVPISTIEWIAYDSHDWAPSQRIRANRRRPPTPILSDWDFDFSIGWYVWTSLPVVFQWWAYYWSPTPCRRWCVCTYWHLCCPDTGHWDGSMISANCSSTPIWMGWRLVEHLVRPAMWPMPTPMRPLSMFPPNKCSCPASMDAHFHSPASRAYCYRSNDEFSLMSHYRGFDDSPRRTIAV